MLHRPTLIAHDATTGEGCDEAQEWFIENVREELDSANEYFFDKANQRLLYMCVS
jgi:hypothetical protein